MNEAKSGLKKLLFFSTKTGFSDKKFKNNIKNHTKKYNCFCSKILDKSTPVLYNINNHYCYYRRKECAYEMCIRDSTYPVKYSGKPQQ